MSGELGTEDSVVVEGKMECSGEFVVEVCGTVRQSVRQRVGGVGCQSMWGCLSRRWCCLSDACLAIVPTNLPLSIVAGFVVE